MKKNFYLIVLVSLFVVSCNYSQSINSADNRLKYEQGKLFFQGNLFSGKLVSFYDNRNRRAEIDFVNGEKDGLDRNWFLNGKITHERKFVAGKKEGIHLGWHEDGQIRFYFQFKDDKFDKENYTWYPNGQVESFMKYENGNLLGHKVWRIDGKIYMNYVMLEQEKIGLSGTKLCRKVEGNNEKTLSY